MGFLMLQVTNSPFSQEQVELLNRLLPSLTPHQAVWLNGYLAALGSGLSATGAAASPAQASAAPPGPSVTVLFGSQSGNCQRLAGEMGRRLTQRGYQAVVSCMSEYKPSDLRKVKYLLVIASTHGEGDPPDRAKPFYEYLLSKRAPKLEGVRYSVLALGDLSYKLYCQTGKVFDQRLEELSGQRLAPRTDCDVDYHESADTWMEGVLDALAKEAPTTAPTVLPGAAPAAAPSPYSRLKPFPAEVLENINLNGRGSDKETRYLKLSLRDSGLTFLPGDSLGVCPENHPELVDDLLRTMNWNADEPVPVGKQELPLREALGKHYEITLLTRPLLEQAAAFSKDGLAELVKKSDEEVQAYTYGRDLLDLVRDFQLAGAPAKDFVRVLRKLPPRLYSISSSCKANPDEVDLTIAAVRYQSYDRTRYGTCSIYCAERIEPGHQVPVYVHENPNFRLPENPDAPMIMVGPGTGVAPFRAFLEEREELGAQGRNWLFFGDRRFRTDFLYHTDWLRWRKKGLLERIDVAFSRDTDQKVYVQHRMLERSCELYAWMQEGAYFYVCGDEKRMAPDVHDALLAVVQKEGRKTAEEAQDYLTQLQQQRRYQRDVY